MKILNKSAFLIAALLAIVGSAYGQQPPDPAASDGNGNTADGTKALVDLQATANDNTGVGNDALSSNTTGNDNSAFGASALNSNSTGSNNTATGYSALYKNTTGTQNTAEGASALYTNKAGKFNTAVGYAALHRNIGGQNNVAVGWEAGFALTAGDNNIEIGNPGVAAESDTIRIGTQGTQTQTFIAGIYENPGVCCDYVVVDSAGQLGTALSPPGANVTTAYLSRLRKQVQRQGAEIRDLKQQMAEMKTLNEATQVALQKLQPKDELVAQR
jgi:hypothetical protein